jgi:hypothetical protein
MTELELKAINAVIKHLMADAEDPNWSWERVLSKNLDVMVDGRNPSVFKQHIYVFVLPLRNLFHPTLPFCFASKISRTLPVMSSIENGF